MKQFLLNSMKNNVDVNVESSEYISLSTKQRPLPESNIQGIINHYELYLDERNKCEDYKMIFTLHPYMSNVLFNAFTEIWYYEGTTTGAIVGGEPTEAVFDNIKQSTRNCVNVTTKDNIDNRNSHDLRYQLIRDTECSHPSLGNFQYHCGIDIFNNHYLRSEGYFSIFENKKKIEEGGNSHVFNTIEDLMIYENGETAKHNRAVPGVVKGVGSVNEDKTWNIEITGSDKRIETRQLYTHLFHRDNILSISEAFASGVKEDNGWIGFYNKSYSPREVNKKGYVINKCINNRNACDFIDFYPDRTLFSFIPKINPNYSGREEYNWSWCLTYPYKKVYDHEGGEYDFFNQQGLKVIWTTKSTQYITTSEKDKDNKIVVKDVPVFDEGSDTYNLISNENQYIYLRTKAKHNFSIGDSVRITDCVNNISTSAVVVGLGDKNGKQPQYYFMVNYSDIAEGFGEKSKRVIGKTIFYTQIHKTQTYVAKIVNGVPCDYYIRVFRKMKEFNSTLNKMAFSRTIFNDNVAQIIYNENVNTRGLKDHLGRDLSEIYLTVVKKNVGANEYYLEGKTSPLYLEYSHCFGKVTSGFNFESSKDELTITDPKSDEFTHYNVRSLYNLNGFGAYNDFLINMGIPFVPPKVVEDDIKPTDNEFFGDFVEFSPSTYSETVIEDIYHRFNTAQRETLINGLNLEEGGSGEGIRKFDMSCFKYDEIEYDDYDFIDEKVGANTTSLPDFKVRINEEGFRGDRTKYGDGDSKCRDNIFPEGYFYKPHHRIKLKEYSESLYTDYDILMKTIENPLTDGFKQTKWIGHFEIKIPDFTAPHGVTREDKIVLYYEKGEYRTYYLSEKSTGNSFIFCDFSRGVDDINRIKVDKTPDGEIIYSNLKYVFFHNLDIPSHAFYVPDGSGKYVWRDVVKETELSQDSDIYGRTYANGAIYINKDINFYLRRQDPHGIYGLKYSYGSTKTPVDFMVNGKEMILPDVDYKTEENYGICEI